MGCPRPTLSYWRVCLLPILALCMGFGVQTAFARPAANSGGATYRPRDVAPAEALVKPVLVHPSTQTAPAIDGLGVVWLGCRQLSLSPFLSAVEFSNCSRKLRSLRTSWNLGWPPSLPTWHSQHLEVLQPLIRRPFRKYPGASLFSTGLTSACNA